MVAWQPVLFFHQLCVPTLLSFLISDAPCVWQLLLTNLLLPAAINKNNSNRQVVMHILRNYPFHLEPWRLRLLDIFPDSRVAVDAHWVDYESVLQISCLSPSYLFSCCANPLSCFCWGEAGQLYLTLTKGWRGDCRPFAFFVHTPEQLTPYSRLDFAGESLPQDQSDGGEDRQGGAHGPDLGNTPRASGALGPQRSEHPDLSHWKARTVKGSSVGGGTVLTIPVFPPGSDSRLGRLARGISLDQSGRGIWGEGLGGKQSIPFILF